MDSYDLKKKLNYTPKILYMEYILINYNNFLKDNLDDKNITQGELTFLYNIFYHESISQRELADVLLVSEAYVTKMLKKLEKKGYVEKKVDDNNKCKRLIYLSQKGMSLTLEILENTREWENKLMNSIEDIDEDKFIKLLFDLAYNSHKL